MRLALRAGFALAAALALASCHRNDDAAFGQRVRTYLLAHPEVIREAANKLQEQDKTDAAKTAAAAIDKHRDQLERDPRDIVVNPTGKITVVEFFDYRCGYCKMAAPQIVQLLKENPDVRFVFKEFPIFGSVSDTAAKLALTPQGKTKGYELYQRWMAVKALDDTSLDANIKQVGLVPADLRSSANNPEIDRQLMDTRTLATALGIEGTPAFIIGGTMVPGADIPAVKAAIIQARAGTLKKPS